MKQIKDVTFQMPFFFNQIQIDYVFLMRKYCVFSVVVVGMNDFVVVKSSAQTSPA